jgi:tRNA(Arg) A34 adenosine deaminase TadA
MFKTMRRHAADDRVQRCAGKGGSAMHQYQFASLMNDAIRACQRGIAAGQSPFGAAIATAAGELIIATHNKVRLTCDITAHAEITAIREACAKLGKIDLSGCVMASTCEPCPMCASAIHWARLDAVVFGANIADADSAGFNELALPIQQVYSQGGSRVIVHADVLRNECCDLFRQWLQGPNPMPY